jgi:hypothetical protein
MERYFVIRNSDGDTTVRSYTKEQLLVELSDNTWGVNINFMDRINSSDTNYWGDNNILIIKGTIEVPIAEKIITKFNIK